MPPDTPPPLPADVRDVLAQLLTAADDSVAASEHDDTQAILDTVETVVRNKVPDPDERERLLAGCGTVRDALGSDSGIAQGYLRSMRRRVRDAPT
ncbi:hypothetical protein GCM10008995_25780 [Halobellus salinus]|uniref:DUF8101 domain-containing protein n=1 Tax=Halobellus salinus TaxID=931585 RepID=A0A830EKM6_9EURY|nr:hypothetical protein [Halobellus salinus]GGJ14749.1 hypothetical protein GCM10008995_25780 [Halobellus salinus]SMP15509.1 hypothetical protein SAMN06265347_105144 [Halobellus salinus]